MAWVKERITDDGDKRFVACYRDPEGRQRSAGTYSSRRAAERAGEPGGGQSPRGRLARPLPRRRSPSPSTSRPSGCPPSRSRPPPWPPTGPTSTSTSSRSSADGRWARSSPRRCNAGSPPPPTNGLSAASVGKYHTMLQLGLRTRPASTGSSPSTPAPTPSCPRGSRRRAAPSPPTEYDAILAALPAQHRLMVETAINTGLRWGELIALKPRHLDLDHRAAHRRGDHRRGLHQELPHRPADAHQALPQGQRTPHHGPPTRAGHPARRPHRRADASSPVTCCSPPATAPPSPGTPSAPGSGDPPSPPPGSTSTYASTTCATPTPPGCSPAAPTSSPSWTAWVTPRSPPPRSTSTPCPTPTPRTSPPSTGPATRRPRRHQSPPSKGSRSAITLQAHHQGRMDTPRSRAFERTSVALLIETHPL